MRSDLQSESRQLSLRFSPTTFSTSYSWSLSYVYGNVRDRVDVNVGSIVGEKINQRDGDDERRDSEDCTPFLHVVHDI